MAPEATPSTDAAARTYRSPLRQRQALRTRELILHAFADLVIAHGVGGATMAAVAERAGVSERTVYRHFPNARALLDGLSAEATEAMRAHGGAGDPRALLADVPRRALELYRAFEAAGPPMKAAIVAGLTEGYRSPDQPGRIESIRAGLRAHLPHLDDEALEEAVVVTRFQLGAQAWYLLTEREGLTTAQAARVSAQAVLAYVRSLREPAAT